MNVSILKTELARKIGQKQAISSRLNKLIAEHETLKRDLIEAEKAQAIIQIVAQKTQNEISYHISDLVSFGLEAISDDPYKFHIEFVTKRNQTECMMTFEGDGISLSPLSGSGGGTADVASFVLRPAIWAITNPSPAKLLIIDEPFKHLDNYTHERAGEILRALSEKMGMQIIMITHSKRLAECADKIFLITKEGGISSAKEIGLTKLRQLEIL